MRSDTLLPPDPLRLVLYTIWMLCLYPIQVYMLQPGYQGDSMRKQTFGQGLDHEDGAHMNGISTLVKGVLESCFAPSAMGQNPMR